MTYRELDIAALVTLVLLFMLPCGPLEADATRYQGAQLTPRSALVLTRLCIGETHERDQYVCAAQVGVIARRAARLGWTIDRMALVYSRALRSPQAGREWVGEYRPGFQPRSFRRASFPRFDRRARRLLRVVESQLAGDVPDPCIDSKPDHFGSVYSDAHRARAAGWERVCESAHDRQGFWRSR